MYVPIQNYDGVSVQMEESVNIGIIRSVESFGPSKEVCVPDIQDSPGSLSSL